MGNVVFNRFADRASNPGSCRFAIAPPAVSLWEAERLRGLAVDRPGFGHSTRLPGRGLRVVADGLALLLDALGIDCVPVIAYSAGGPHGLAFAACHPERVELLMVVSGACPLLTEERRRVVGANAVLADLVERGWDAVHEYLVGLRTTMLEHGTLAVLGDADPRDLKVLGDVTTGQRSREYRREALRQGAEGWADETMALLGPWDFDLADVSAPVRWWHGAHDSVLPLSAVERLTEQLGDCKVNGLGRSCALPAGDVDPS